MHASLFEDLRAEEIVPRKDPYWKEGWALGLFFDWQYSHNASESVAKRTMQELRLADFLVKSLEDTHEYSIQEATECGLSQGREDIGSDLFFSFQAMSL